MKIREYIEMKKPAPIEKKHYLLYARKSSETEDRQIQSNDDQVKALKPIIESKSLPLLKTFRESCSAKAPGRPVFNEMLNLIGQRKDIKGIICWKLNRLTRNPVDTGTIQWLLQNGDIDEIITPSKTYTEVDSDFIMAVEGAQANRFIRDLREDTVRGINTKLEKGQFPGMAPTGYKNNVEKRQGEKDISPHPIYFTLMKKLFDFALTGNFSFEQLRLKAKDLGIKNNRGNFISKTGIQHTFTNPFYTGKFLYDGRIHQGSHVPMLTEDEFDLLQDIMSGRSHPRLIKHSFPINGLIRCGYCGMMITGEEHKKTYKNGNTQVFTYYRCSKKNRQIKCPEPAIPAGELGKQVIEFLGHVRLSSKFPEWAIKWLNEENKEQNAVMEAKYKSLKESYEDAVKRINNLTDMKISPLNVNGCMISDGEFAEKREELVKERDRIQKNLSQIDSNADDWTDLAVKTFDFAATAQRRFASGGVEVKKTILRAIGLNLVLKGKKVEIQPRTPFVSIKGAVEQVHGPEWFEPEENVEVPAEKDSFDPQNPIWGDRWGSNPQPPAPQAGALPIELRSP